jgi:RNA polymerase sigma factor (sigma-70 family)
VTEASTTELWQRCHGGESAAISELVAAHLDWLTAHVRRRLGAMLTGRDDVCDLVQDAAVAVLARGPRFLPANARQLRALLGRMVENLVRDRLEWHQAEKRDVRRERAVPRDSVLILDPTARSVTRPSEAAAENEMQAWVQLALELIGAADRRIVLMRQWEEMSFHAIGAALGIPENTARMRFQAALNRLGARLRELMQGRVRCAEDAEDAGA